MVEADQVTLVRASHLGLHACVHIAAASSLYSTSERCYCLLPTAYFTAYCLLYCLLPTAYFTAYFLLPTAYCLLPTAYFLPPTAYPRTGADDHGDVGQRLAEAGQSEVDEHAAALEVLACIATQGGAWNTGGGALQHRGVCIGTQGRCIAT